MNLFRFFKLSAFLLYIVSSGFLFAANQSDEPVYQNVGRKTGWASTRQEFDTQHNGIERQMTDLSIITEQPRADPVYENVTRQMTDLSLVTAQPRQMTSRNIYLPEWDVSSTSTDGRTLGVPVVDLPISLEDKGRCSALCHVLCQKSPPSLEDDEPRRRNTLIMNTVFGCIVTGLHMAILYEFGGPSDLRAAIMANTQDCNTPVWLACALIPASLLKCMMRVSIEPHRTQAWLDQPCRCYRRPLRAIRFLGAPLGLVNGIMFMTTTAAPLSDLLLSGLGLNAYNLIGTFDDICETYVCTQIHDRT